MGAWEGMRIQALFFDNDGVLVDSEHCYFEANRRVLAEHGIAMDFEDYHEHFLRTSTGIHHFFPEASQEFLADFRRKRMQHHLDLLASEPILIPGVKEVLSRLRGHFRMGVVTSSEKKPFSLIHARTGLSDFFDFTVCREDVRFSKPHPEPYLKALALSGFPREACLVIEDAERGLRAALAAGLRCWVLPGPLNSQGDFSGAERVLEHIGVLPSLLLP